MIEMTELESAVLAKCLEGDNPVLKVLRCQLVGCEVESREMTGVGFYANLSVDSNLVEDVNCNIELDDVLADIDGLKHGAMFVLYVRGGRLDTLEGCSYAEPWPESISTFTLSTRVQEAS